MPARKQVVAGGGGSMGLRIIFEVNTVSVRRDEGKITQRNTEDCREKWELPLLGAGGQHGIADQWLAESLYRMNNPTTTVSRSTGN